MNLIERLVYGFALSLILNCLVVAALVAAGAYTGPVLWTLIAVQVVAALILQDVHRESWLLDLTQLARVRELNLRSVVAGLRFGATVAMFVRLFWVNWGSVFIGNAAAAIPQRFSRPEAGSGRCSAKLGRVSRVSRPRNLEHLGCGLGERESGTAKCRNAIRESKMSDSAA
jgi:hypothetical protein